LHLDKSPFVISTPTQRNEQSSLYFFQFPSPFPEFSSSSSVAAKGKEKARETEAEGTNNKRVSFAPDLQPDPKASGPEIEQSTELQSTVEVKGIIGQLEVYESGVVKMRLANGITLDVGLSVRLFKSDSSFNQKVNGSTQPFFLQHAAYINSDKKQMCVLGEVDRRFVVSPDIDTLLETLEKVEHEQEATSSAEFNGLLAMDTS
jgi:DNA-directed RNA polymerase III subunit RPC4